MVPGGGDDLGELACGMEWLGNGWEGLGWVKGM